MRRRHRHTKLRSHDHGDGGSHRNGIGPHVVEFCDLLAHCFDQTGTIEGQAGGQTQRPQDHHPQGRRRLDGYCTRFDRLINRSQRSYGVGHIIGSVRKAEQSRRTDQRPGEKAIDTILAVVLPQGHPLKRFAHQHPHQSGENRTDAQCAKEANLVELGEAFEHHVGAESPSHRRNQPGHDPAGRVGHLAAISDAALDQVKKRGSNGTAHHRRNHPAHHDGADRGPIDQAPATRGYARAQDSTNDGVGR